MKENRARAFCSDNFLSMQSLLAMSSLRKQYLELLRASGFVQDHSRTLSEHSDDTTLLRAIISAGLYPGVLSVMKDAVSCTFKTVEDEEVEIHANSVNARNKMGIRFPWLVFNEKVKTSHLFIRDATGISDSMLLLFGGRLTFGNEPGHLLMDRSGLEFFMRRDLANLYVHLRNTLDTLLQKKFRSPSLNIYSEYSPLLMALQHLLHGDHCEGSFVSGCIDLNKVNDLVALKSCGTSFNAKNELREQLQKEGIRIRPFLNTSIIKGPENDRQFVSILQVRDLRFVGEPAKSKKQAERVVCADAVRWLRDPSNSREKNKKFWGSMKPRTETKR
ncbi:hypothetical protein O6H91_Y433800 [Diphasiastrum complanatum]|nr:hypothetical protein O6H91_Y433800 [Diphasiastrum complanatum]